MNNKKGFTLIEIIAVIVILGLILIIAVPFFQGSLNVFRDDYYSELSNNINDSAKEFFKDNRLFLPNRYLDTQKVDLNTLNDQKYLEQVVDYNGKKCNSNNGYVIAVKTGIDKYEYAACFECEEDDFSYKDNVYCSEAWDNNKGFTEVVFDAPPDIHVYVGTSREKLKELVVVYPDIRRCLGVGTCVKEIKRVSAKGDIGVQPIYPKDLDSVDTNTVGTYEVTYVYDLQDKDNTTGEVKEKKGRVIVYDYQMKNYDNSKPENENDIYFTKYNTVYKQDDSNTVVQKTTEEKTLRYNPNDDNDWAQKLNIKFNYNNKLDDKPVMVARYQWFLNGRWEDICVPNREGNKNNNSCSKTIGRVSGGFELNDEMRFRFIDVEGRVSKESKYKIRVDYTAPDTCALQLGGTKGTRTEEAKTWYVSDAVKVSFASKEDAVNTSGHSGGNVSSGINYYGVTTSKRTSNEFDNQTQDTTSVTWYGYIEDKAGNFTVCNTTFKKDSTVPTCTSSGDNDTWKKSAVTVSWGCQDDTSKCVTTTSTKKFSTDGTYQKTWDAPAYDIYDKAGNHTACDSISRNIYFDKKAPECSNSGDSTTYTKNNRKIYYGCSDNSESGQSGCKTATKNVEYSTTTVTDTIAAYTIKDVAGNSTNCPDRVANVYVDKTNPTCSTSKTSTGSTGGVTVSISCSDDNSGCSSSNTTSESGVKADKNYTVSDGAGNTGTCSVSIESYSCEPYVCGSEPCGYDECADTRSEAYTGTCTRTVYFCPCNSGGFSGYTTDSSCGGVCQASDQYDETYSCTKYHDVCVPGYTSTCDVYCNHTCYK